MRDQASLDDFLCVHGLATHSEKAHWTPLMGGVSSEIWRVDLPGRSLCVKRALPKLNVAADWKVPRSRNAYEWKWLCFVAKHEPQAVPSPLAHDEKAGLFAMSFLEPEHYPVWKSQLLQGEVRASTASQVGALLARLHSASANRPDLARSFDSLKNFHALRLEPYLLATAERHAELAGRLRELVQRTSRISLALVHGDVSPKNVLVGPAGPVVLDAECAWYGDPAFDVAFCLNHLLLKCLIRPDRAAELIKSFALLTEVYFKVAEWEVPSLIEARVAHLLPGLMLARIDGKSPVEYLVDRPMEQATVRRVARALLLSPVEKLGAIAEIWSREITE